MAFVRLIRFAHSRRKLAHPVHLKMHRYVIPLSPPQKKEPLGLLFCGGESGIRTHEALYGGLHDFESCAFNRAPPSLQLRLPFNNTLFYPDCKAFILTFQPLCLICHSPLYPRRYLPLVFLFYFSSIYSLYSLLFFSFPFISFMHTIYSNILSYFILCALLCLSVLLLPLFPARFYAFYAFKLLFRCFGFTPFIEKSLFRGFFFYSVHI